MPLGLRVAAVAVGAHVLGACGGAAHPLGWQHLAVGVRRACVVDTQGDAYCIDLDAAREGSPRALVEHAGAFRGPVAVGARLCGADGGGRVRCSGAATFAMPELADVAALRGDAGRVLCAVDGRGQLACMDVGSYSSDVPRAIDVTAIAIGPVRAVLVGLGELCVVDGDGDFVRCGTLDVALAPRVERTVGWTVHGGELRDIAGTPRFACGLFDDGTVRCWQHPERGDPPVPLDLPRVSAVVSDTGNWCALTVAREVFCWNRDLAPRQVGGLADVVDIAVLGGTACATSPTRLWCWLTDRVPALPARPTE